MTLLRPTPISTDRFRGDAETRRFLAEASDLPRGLALGRVYDDACDVGFTLVSPRGTECVFALAGEERDREGELLYTEFKPAPGQHLTPESIALGMTVRIYND